MKVSNVFNTPGLCAVSGNIRPPSKLPNAKQFTRPTTEFNRYGIVIPQQADADRRATFKKASI